MSLSDSDLDFESADEGGGEDVDIELSDLSDDDEKPSEMPSEKKAGDDDTLVKPAEEEGKTETRPEPNSEPEEPEVETKSDENDKSDAGEVSKDEPQKPMEQDQGKQVETERPEEKLDVEGDDEIDRLLEDMNIKEVEPVKQEVTKAEPQPVAKRVEPVSTGWDDTEFSDVEKDKDKDSEPPKAEPLVQPKPVEEKKPAEPSKPKDIASLFSSLESKPEPRAQAQPETKQSGWSWSKFGSTFISSATALLETVEGAIGAPDPAELAAKVAKAQAENEKIQEELAANPETKADQSEKTSSDSFNDWDTNEWFTLPKQLNKLATTGTQLVSSSLDVLESVGKTTIEVINNKDPNLKQTREFFKAVPLSHNTSLSDLLREAQASGKSSGEQAAANVTSASAKQASPIMPDKLTFSLYFEEYKGVVILEALDMLSKQTALKIEASNIKSSLYKKLPADKQAQLKSIEQIFDEENLNIENTDEDEDAGDEGEEGDDFKRLVHAKDKSFDLDNFEAILNDYSSKLNLRAHSEKLLSAFKASAFTITEVDDAVELRSQSVRCFALLTAKLIEFYHKAAESILMDYETSGQQQTSARQQPKNKQLGLIIEKASNFYRMTRVFLKSLSILADDFSKKCRRIGKDQAAEDPTISVNQIISDIYLEASNCNTYISDAFLLFLPFFKIHFMSKED